MTEIAIPPTPVPAPDTDPMPSEADLDAMFDKARNGPEGEDPGGDQLEPEPAAATDPPDNSEPEPTPVPVAASPEPAPAEPVKVPPAVAPEPVKAAPAPEPVIDEEAERNRILDAENELERIKRDYVKRTGKPVRDPADILQDAEGHEALRQLREDYPELHKAFEAMTRGMVRRDELQDYVAELSTRVEAGEITVQEKLQLSQVAAAHPDLGSIQEHPEHLFAWIDELPYAAGREIERAVTQGTTAEASAALTQFKQAKGITSYAELLSGGAPAGAATGSADPPPSQVKEPPAPAPVNPARLAAAQAIPGAGTQAPLGEPRSAIPSEKDLDAMFENTVKAGGF